MAKKTLGILALLGALGLFLKGGGSNASSTANPPQVPIIPPPNPNNPTPTPTPVTLQLGTGQVINYFPYNFVAPTPGSEQVFNTTWNITGVTGYNEMVAAFAQDPNLQRNMYRTGWALLHNIPTHIVPDGTNTTGIWEVVLYNAGFTPALLYNQNKDAITTLGQLLGQQIVPPVPSLQGVNWNNVEDDIAAFCTGFMFLSPAGLTNFLNAFWHIQPTVKNFCDWQLTIPMALYMQNLWTGSSSGQFNSNFPH